MKHLLILSVIFATAAFGAVDDAFLAGTVGGEGFNGYSGWGPFYNRLVTSEAEIYSNALDFGQVGPYWMADDYEADDDYTYDQYRLHYLYFNYASAVGDTFFEVYETDLNTSPIADFTVVVTDITETDTGWTFAGRPIFLGEFPFPANVSLTNGTAYWTALSMDSTDSVFCVMVDGAYDWEYAMQDQGSGFIDPGHHQDMSCAWGDIWTLVESASLGAIKAAFK
jgi:hypothetical protein